MLDQNRFIKSPPTRRAPVPERDWTMAMWSDWIALDCDPKTSSATNLPYSGNPGIGAYSDQLVFLAANTFIKLLFENTFLCFEDTFEDIRFPSIVTIRSNPQIDFLIISCQYR